MGGGLSWIPLKVLLYDYLVGVHGHFQSRDKDGGHAIRSAITENPMLCANFTTLSFIEPELLLTEVLHGGDREFRVFCGK